MAAHELSRRAMIAGTVGGGFALAVRPVSASTITTDAHGLDAGAIQIPSANGPGSIPAYRAIPAKRKGKPPIVVVVHEIFGVHEHIKDYARLVQGERRDDVDRVERSAALPRGAHRGGSGTLSGSRSKATGRPPRRDS